MAKDWRTEGVRIVKAGELDPNTPQTPGMSRAAAIDFARGGGEEALGGNGRRPAQRQDRRP